MSAPASSSETRPSRTGGRERCTAQPPAGPALTRPLLEIAAASPASPAWSVLLSSESPVDAGGEFRVGLGERKPSRRRSQLPGFGPRREGHWDPGAVLRRKDLDREREGPGVARRPVVAGRRATSPRRIGWAYN